MPKYTQTFTSLAPQFKAQDDGLAFTITVPASNRKQAIRRLRTLLYGRSAVAVSMLKTVGNKRLPKWKYEILDRHARQLVLFGKLKGEKCPHCRAGYGPLRPGAHPTKHGSIAHISSKPVGIIHGISLVPLSIAPLVTAPAFKEAQRISDHNNMPRNGY